MLIASASPGAYPAIPAVTGVDGVVVEDEGRYVVVASADVREAVAAAVVPFGVLELGHRGLEHVFLQLTREAA
jgi:hypothetical protein